MAKAKFQATIQKNDAHINVLLGKINDPNTLIRVLRTVSIWRRLNALRTNTKKIIQLKLVKCELKISRF